MEDGGYSQVGIQHSRYRNALKMNLYLLLEMAELLRKSSSADIAAGLSKGGKRKSKASTASGEYN